MLAGNEYPPTAWMNQRLHDLGERWTFTEATPNKVSSSPAQIIKEVLPEPKKAELQFSFWESDPQFWPQREKWVYLNKNKAVEVETLLSG